MMDLQGRYHVLHHLVTPSESSRGVIFSKNHNGFYYVDYSDTKFLKIFYGDLTHDNVTCLTLVKPEVSPWGKGGIMGPDGYTVIIDINPTNKLDGIFSYREKGSRWVVRANETQVRILSNS